MNSEKVTRRKDLTSALDYLQDIILFNITGIVHTETPLMWIWRNKDI